MNDAERYGLTGEQAAAVRALAPAQLEMAYRLQLRAYHAQDARDRAADILDEDVLARLDDSDYDCLAQAFEDEHDCNVPDNALWETIIERYVRT